MSTTSAQHSLWFDRAVADVVDVGATPLPEDASADVVVIGGGIAGVTTALTLAEHGVDVIVLEADRVARGVTGCTTAKASALQGAVYSAIRSKHDEQAAATYAAASTAAVERIAQLVDSYGIDCEPHRRTAYTYAASESERSSVQ
jgi:glycine/D-amino acid oxidase-like deaminating enzyme